MTLGSKSIAFLNSPQGLSAKDTLQQMFSNNNYNTLASYSANTTDYPDNLIPFVDKHIYYLCTHPTVNPDHYLANLRLMTRLR